MPRSFVHFILEPFYKIVSHTISSERQELQPVLKKLGLFLKKKEYQLDIKPLLKLVLTNFFGSLSCLVDSMTEHFKSAAQSTATKVNTCYRNSQDDASMKS